MPCLFIHPERKLKVCTHVDDFLRTSAQEDLQWLKRELQAVFELKRGILSHGNSDLFLGRRISIEDWGIGYECGSKHVDILLKEWDMEGCSPVSPPGSGEERGHEDDEDLNGVESTSYRRAAAKINYMALDRPDLSFAAKELPRGNSRPKVGDKLRLLRVLRYLRGKPRVQLQFIHQDEQTSLTTYIDSDWGGCQRTRKSTSGGAMFLGKHLLRHRSSPQGTVARS